MKTDNLQDFKMPSFQDVLRGENPPTVPLTKELVEEISRQLFSDMLAVKSVLSNMLNTAAKYTICRTKEFQDLMPPSLEVEINKLSEEVETLLERLESQ